MFAALMNIRLIRRRHNALFEKLSIFSFLLVVIALFLGNITGVPSAEAQLTFDPSIEGYAWGMPNQGWAPLTIYLSPYGSHDPQGNDLRYEWDLDGDGLFETDATQTAGYIEHTFVQAGEHTILLRVSNPQGQYGIAATVIEVRHPASSSVNYWTVFDDTRVKRIDLLIAQAQWDTIWLEPHAKIEVQADAIIFGERVSQIGLSMKGNATLDASGEKKPWKLDFNAFIEGQEFQNLPMLLLHNNFSDPSMLREKLAYDMARFAGVPAAHVAFVEVWIDIMDDNLPIEYWGVYALVERPDRKFLANRFGPANRDGNLYKADAWFEQGAADFAYYGEDINHYPMPRGRIAYRKMTNEDAADYTDIIRLAYVLDEQEFDHPAEFMAALEAEINVDTFLRYMAVIFTNLNLDTYPYTGNNFYIYHHPGSDQFEWIAWDMNNSWGNFGGGTEFPLYGVKESIGPLAYAPLFEKVFAIERYRLTYRAYVDLLLRHWFNEEDFTARTQALYEMIDPYLNQETGDKAFYGETSMFSIQDFEAGLDQITTLTTSRAEFLQKALAQEERFP